MAEPAHRRTTSELDMSSMRRISEALLLAQNRARRATDRANYAEHVLNLVLSQVNVRRLRVGSVSDWEMLRATVVSNPLLIRRPSDGRGLRSSEDVSSSAHDLHVVAKDVVTNLEVAMSCHMRYVKQVELPTNRLSRMRSMNRRLFVSVSWVAGFLVGVLVGIAVTRHWHLQVHTQKSSGFGKWTKWYSRRKPVVYTPWHLLSRAPHDYTYLMHPALVEVG